MLEHLVEMGGQSLQFGLAFVFGALVLCGFGLPLPEDIILVAGGVLAWRASPLEQAALATMLRDEGLLWMIGAGLGGILGGDFIIFLLGRRFGIRVADFRPLRRVITPDKLEKVEKLMRRRGKFMVVLARYIPGLRAPTYFTAGHARMPVWEFLLLDGVAALVSAPLWVCIGFYFGSNLEAAAREAHRFGHYILVGAALLVLGLALRWVHHRHRRRAGRPPESGHELTPPPERGRPDAG
jgi:membrane protein DedA with SNARE-associated domain